MHIQRKADRMQITGVIAEYNPLHGGHISQLQRIRKELNADYIIVVMSGDFVQRGEPAVFDKAVRTRAALYAGADLVLELPVIFSTASAPDFAASATALIDRLGVVTDLCFGSECGDLSLLSAAADVLCEEPLIFRETLKECLRSGDSYPKARAKALAVVLENDEANGYSGEYDDIFASPNNILGIEYIKALKLRNSPVRAFTYKREGQSYHDGSDGFLISGDNPSALAVRKALAEKNFDYFDYLNRILAGAGDTKDPISSAVPVFADDLSLLLNAKLLELSSDLKEDELPEKLASYSGFSPELASRLSRRILSFDSFSARCASLKSRSYTYARVSRALLHVILGITDNDVERAKQNDCVSYIRVLGFRRSAEELLNAIHNNSSLPLITKTAGAAEHLSADGRLSFSRDLYASHLYQSVVRQKSGTVLPNEYTRPLIIVSS